MGMSTQGVRPPSAGKIARSAVIVIGIMGFGKLFSLSEKWIGLDRFGVGVDWDTFAAANQLPEQLYNLIGGGALAFAFIPIFSGILARGDRDQAWKLASNVLNTIFLAAFLLSTITFLFAPQIISTLIAPGFAKPFLPVRVLQQPFSGDLFLYLARPDLVMQTAYLMRILLLSLMIFSVSGLCSGILHTHQHFVAPALAPIMYDVGNLLGVAFLARFFGIYGAAIGAVIGAALHLSIQLVALVRVRARWLPYLNWRNPELRQVIRLMIPRAISLGLANLDLLIAYNIASTLGSGSVAAFNRGWTLMQLPQTLIGTAMGIVIFPTLAVLSANGDLSGKRSAMSGALRFVLIASIPAALMMVVAGRPLVAILEGGAFDPASADRVFAVLQMFALGILTWNLLEIVARSFYADKDMITPLISAVIETVVFISLALMLTQTLQTAGLALANSIAVGVQVTFLAVILRRRWQGLDAGALFRSVFKACIGAAAMVVAMLAIAPFVENLVLPLDRRLLLLVQAGLQIGVGGVVYLGVMVLLRTEEVLQLPRLILARRQMQTVGD
ncbi:MAG: murein biosynthesis integral membrane protein MurJ [Candidatus Thermofonsia Clade 1 bacterium]|uniref:Probable lipid II flippase MurJ n=1 Tax=Candidatus Thermofonsia Clade 1 bacterium TaxID=2364210 RepID=A0A2M8P435_9CHLR|nr:MAG: murein biosynthesis integral membrane protein MurJ [Candidatus Thermofonsia Clade 1 bacterium]